MAGANPLLNSPGYIQAVTQNALEEQRCQQQQQALDNAVNLYLANLTPDQNELAICLVRCGVDQPRMLYHLLQEGFHGLRDLRTINLKDLTEMATRISRKPTSEGPVNIASIEED